MGAACCQDAWQRTAPEGSPPIIQELDVPRDQTSKSDACALGAAGRHDGLVLLAIMSHNSLQSRARQAVSLTSRLRSLGKSYSQGAQASVKEQPLNIQSGMKIALAATEVPSTTTPDCVSASCARCRTGLTVKAIFSVVFGAPRLSRSKWRTTTVRIVTSC